MLSEAHPLQLSITSNALGMVQNPESAKRKSRTLSLTSLPHASGGVGSRTLDKCALASHSRPLPNALRDAHASVRQPALPHGNPSVHRRTAATPLVFLAGAAGTRIVPTDLVEAVRCGSLVWASIPTCRCTRTQRYALKSPPPYARKQQPSRRRREWREPRTTVWRKCVSTQKLRDGESDVEVK
jgi:hypothetical protein